MDDLNDILAGVDILMTPALTRLFKAAGCSPTQCHACGGKIKDGQPFKLVTHRKPGEAADSDEMCCDNCGPLQLDLRDQRNARDSRGFRTGPRISNVWAGFSRPSK